MINTTDTCCKWSRWPKTRSYLPEHPLHYHYPLFVLYTAHWFYPIISCFHMLEIYLTFSSLMKTYAVFVMPPGWNLIKFLASLSAFQMIAFTFVFGFTAVAEGSHCEKGEQIGILTEKSNYKRIFWNTIHKAIFSEVYNTVHIVTFYSKQRHDQNFQIHLCCSFLYEPVPKQWTTKTLQNQCWFFIIQQQET